MSAAEIIREIPNLTIEELRVLAARIVELDPELDTVRQRDKLATQTTRLLGRLEERNARRANPRASD